MNENVAANALGMQGQMREKLWTERDTMEKIEALRMQILHLTDNVNYLLDAMEKMFTHSHDATGSLCAPFSEIVRWKQRGNRIPISLRDHE